MSLDYQKSPYVQKKGDAKKRTSYGRMNNWYEYSEKDGLANPYEAADHGIFRKLEPVLNVPLRESEHYSYHGYQPTRRWTPNKSPTRTPRLGSPEPVSAPAVLRERGFPRMEESKITTTPHIEPGPVSGQYYKSGGYDDYHKAYLQLQKLGISPTYPKFGPPRLRNGRVGGSWRHIKEVLQAKGERTVFVDGVPRGQDNDRITNEHIPGVDLLQPKYGPDITSAQPRHTSPSGHKWTAHDLEAFKASEAGNWLIMR